MRIFFGATLPENTKTQTENIQEELRNNIDGIRIEAREKLHITLHFIGDFMPEKIESLFSSVSGEVKRSGFKSSLTEVDGLSYFPSEKIRRGIWIDCRDDGTLGAIAETVKSVAEKFGVIPERRAFRPHITIARFRGEGGTNRKNYLDLQKLWSNGKLSIERFFPKSIALFESTLKSSGSEYEVLSDIPLIEG